jgi:outer membrane protein assembly factor BamA
MIRRSIIGTLLAAALLAPSVATAQVARTKVESAPEAAVTSPARGLDPKRLEVGGAPVIMADTDLGFGLGGLISLTRFGPGQTPFRWQLQALLFVTMKSGAEGVETTFHDDFVKLDLPGLLGGKLRLTTTVGFTRRSNGGYYGIGNAAESGSSADARRNQYDRIYPQALVRARIKLGQHLGLMLGSSFTYNWVKLYEGSKLAEDLGAEDDPDLRDRLRGAGEHASFVVDGGLFWDTRDHDMVPSRGAFHEASIRFTPDPRSETSYAGATLALRFYRSLVGDRLVFATRLMADMLLGDPPIYELSRIGGLFPMPSPGGGSGIRGVPMGRYHGKIKLITNFELRARLLPFTIFNQRFNVGTTAFVDAGRVWTDFSSPVRFDGDAPGIKLGLGGGLRIQWGEALLLRADLAWSPDADPVGFYFNINHVF